MSLLMIGLPSLALQASRITGKCDLNDVTCVLTLAAYVLKVHSRYIMVKFHETSHHETSENSLYVHTCVYVCVYLCKGVHECMYVYIYGNQMLTSSILFVCFLPYFLRLDPFLNLELINAARLAGQWFPGLHFFLPQYHWDYRCACHYVWLLDGCWRTTITS